jgi:hypothetical protein
MSNPISAIASVAGSLIGSSGAKSAANTQAAASDRANALQYQMFQEQNELQRPWREAGEDALGFLREGIQPDGQFMQRFGMDQFQADPGYGFRLGEGLKALDRQAAARGGLISGAALKGAQRYGQDMASQEYGNAFNRFRAETGDIYNRLAGVAGTGQTAVNQLGAFGQNTANQMGANTIGAGNARASGYMGQANAIAGGLGQMGNMYAQNQMLNRFFPSGGGGGGGGPNIYNEGGYGDFGSGGFL